MYCNNSDYDAVLSLSTGAIKISDDKAVINEALHRLSMNII